MKLIIVVLLTFLTVQTFAQQNIPVAEEKFNADWAKIDKRTLPEWFNEAKFGIFVVWGPYSVPGFANEEDYAEWYMQSLLQSSRRAHEATAAYHKKAFGDNVKYEDFGDMLTAELWDPDEWCALFKRSGAKYVVTTANYHDGYAMYPTKYSQINDTKNWNSWDRGARRDIIGELNDAGNKVGLKMGIYYSLYEWYHPLWKTDKDKFVTDHFHPKFKEVVSKYKPWSIFLDGDWSMPGTKWRTNELAQWLYNESPVKDVVVVNDRWGSSRGINGDVFESEYGYGQWTSPEHPWQEDRGIGQSYGYNRNEGIDDYNNADELLEQLCLVTAGGGNFLLCVGPTGDGRIPVIMQERLLQIGDWLKVNGNAIYGAKSNPFWPRTFDWGTVTSKKDTLFLHVFNPTTGAISIEGFQGKVAGANINGRFGKEAVTFKCEKGKLSLNWPKEINQDEVTVITLVTEGVCSFDKTQRQWASGELYLTARAFQYSNPEIKPAYKGFRNRMKVEGWNNSNDYAKAEVIVAKPGTYKLSVAYMATNKNQTGNDIEIEMAGQKFNHTTVLCKENDDFVFEPKELGEVNIEQLGTFIIKIKGKDEGTWNGFGFQSFKLEPAN